MKGAVPTTLEARLAAAAWIAALACLVGTALTLGVTVAPWLGWGLGCVAFTAAALAVTGRVLDAAANERMRSRAAPEPPHRPPGPVPLSLD